MAAWGTPFVPSLTVIRLGSPPPHYGENSLNLTLAAPALATGPSLQARLNGRDQLLGQAVPARGPRFVSRPWELSIAVRRGRERDAARGALFRQGNQEFAAQPRTAARAPLHHLQDGGRHDEGGDGREEQAAEPGHVAVAVGGNAREQQDAHRRDMHRCQRALPARKASQLLAGQRLLLAHRPQPPSVSPCAPFVASRRIATIDKPARAMRSTADLSGSAMTAM